MNNLIEKIKMTEVVDYQGEKYYKWCTKEEFANIQAKNETIYFDISQVFLKSSAIKSWRDADEEEILIMLSEKTMNNSQKRIFNSSKKNFLDFYWGAKPLNKKIINSFIENAMKWKICTFWR